MMMMISGIMQIQYYYYYSSTTTTTTTSFQFGRSTTTSLSNGFLSLSAKTRRRSAPAFTTSSSIHKLPSASASASASGNNLFWSPDSDKTTPPPPSLSDILWPSLGGFAAMAMLGKIDQMLAPKGMAMTIPPLGAVCAVLFVTPNAPAARKYNMFTAQIGCAALGVLAFTIFGPGWLARSAALAAALAFMIYTKSMHPPAASLPLMFIDGAKLHGLNYWYAFFPGAAGCILLSLIVVSMDLLQHAKANIGDYDDHWKNREQTAKTNAAKAFNTNPHTVANNLNSQVHEVLNNNNNNKRRGLGKQHSDDEACLAANPIDRCWRCDKDWDKKREKLADCVLGFGHKTRGGGQKGGRIYQVTDNTDSDLLNPKPGTLRHAVIQDGPLWITFKHGMVIKLQQELLVSSNKTIDGRGGHVHIAGGAGIMLQFVDNVIIHNVHIHDIKTGNGGYIRDSISHYGFRTASDGDGISIFGSTNIWIDHVSMSNCMDGLIDAIEASTAITISNCHFTDHNDVMLFGASDSSTKDEIMQVTLAFNHFGKRLIQRMPRCRFGFFHVVNNDYTHWEMYAIGGSQHPTIISQGNRFIAPPNDFAKEVTKREYAPYSVWKDWLWTSEQDIMMNGAFFNQSGDKSKEFSYTRQDMIKFKPGTYVRRLTRFSGALFCKPDKPC